MAKRSRTPLDLPSTSAGTRTVLDQLRKHRENVAARKRVQADQQDQARKIRIAARLVRFVRRGNSTAKKLLDQIFDGLRDGDRPLFVGWDLYPPPPPPVPISDRQLPRTLQEIDDEIRRLEAHLEKRLAEDKKDDKRQFRRRMTIVGGGLLGLVEAGSVEADAMLDTILEKIPKKESAPFDGWERPRSPANAAKPANRVSTSQATGEPHSGAASPPDARDNDEKTAANPAGQTSTTTATGKSKTAPDKRAAEDPASNGTSARKHAERGEAPDSDTEAEPSEPNTSVPLEQGAGTVSAASPPDVRDKDEKEPAASPEGTETARGNDEKEPPAASPAGQNSTTTAAGKSRTAAAMRAGEGSTSTRTLTKDDARGAKSGADTEAEPSEPTIPFALDQGSGEP